MVAGLAGRLFLLDSSHSSLHMGLPSVTCVSFLLVRLRRLRRPSRHTIGASHSTAMLHGSSRWSGSWWGWEGGCHTKVWMADVESSQSLRESICHPIKTTHSLSFPRAFQGALAPHPPELPWQCILCVSWPLF